MSQLTRLFAYASLSLTLGGCTINTATDEHVPNPVEREFVDTVSPPVHGEVETRTRDLLFRPDDIVLTVPPAEPPPATLQPLGTTPVSRHD